MKQQRSSARARYKADTRVVMCPRPEQYLANAVIMRAVEDYINAKRNLMCRPNQADNEMKLDCLAFFFSGWFNCMCDLNPAELVDRIDEMLRTERRHA